MSCMAIMMKGVIKGFNKRIGNLFVEKEREIEIQIGGPTDVQHVGHIGWDGPTPAAEEPSGNGAPSWMGEFQTGPNYAQTSISRTPGLSHQDLPILNSLSEAPGGLTTPKKRRKKHRKSKESNNTEDAAAGGGGSSEASKSPKKRRSKTKVAEESQTKQE